MPFVKLDCGILDSSIWVETSDTRICWITMLAMADAGGLVASTAPGIARRACISIEAARLAISTFESPEVDSRSDDDGRRIQRVDGGYQILNYQKYRDKDYTAARRAKKYRESKASRRDGRDETVTVTQAYNTDTHTKQETNTGRFTPPSLKEVSEYCSERHNSVDPQQWLDFYTAKGWTIGKSKMKDWRAAVRTWERNGRSNGRKDEFEGFIS